MALLIRVADIICCRQQIGLYLTARNDTITEDMFDALCITQDQIDEIMSFVRDAETLWAVLVRGLPKARLRTEDGRWIKKSMVQKYAEGWGVAVG